MGFYDAFFGSDQSLYTAYAIIAAIIAICLTILLTSTDVPVGNRFLIVFFVIITLVPSIFLTLFELTCIVTGGTEPNRWWCHAFAWILAAFIIIYCVIVVIVSLVSLFNYNKAIDTVNNDEQKYKLSNNESNNYAKEIIDNNNRIENFEALNNIPDPFKQLTPNFTNNLTSTDDKDKNNTIPSNPISPPLPTPPSASPNFPSSVGFETLVYPDKYNDNNKNNNTEEQELRFDSSKLKIPGPPPPQNNNNKANSNIISPSTSSPSTSSPSKTLGFSNFNDEGTNDSVDMFDGFYNLNNFGSK